MYNFSMSDKNQKARKLMDKGWRLREDLEFEEAEKLLNEAKELFEEDEDWFNVTEALNHLAYSEKLRAVHSSLRGLELAEQSLGVAEEHGTKKTLVLRALMSLANSAGAFEKALKYGLEALPLFRTPADKADILSHIATFYLRTGRPDEAEKHIEMAKEEFEKGRNDVDDPHRTIWETKIMLTESVILYNKGDTDEAKKLGERALGMANKAGLKTRSAEIKTFLELFDLH